MRLEDLVFLSEQNTTSGEFDVKLDEPNDFTDRVKIKYGHVTGPLDDVTISWGEESHNVDFEETSPPDVVDDLGESEVIDYVAYSQDDKWRFMVNVNVEKGSGEVYDVYWKTLIIDIDDSKKEPLSERLQVIAGIKKRVI